MKRIFILLSLLFIILSCKETPIKPYNLQGNAVLNILYQSEDSICINYQVSSKSGNINGFGYGSVTFNNTDTLIEKYNNANIIANDINNIYIAIKGDVSYATNDGTPFIDYKDANLTLYKYKLNTKDYKNINKIIIQ